jgi:hypothetical protein
LELGAEPFDDKPGEPSVGDSANGNWGGMKVYGLDSNEGEGVSGDTEPSIGDVPLVGEEVSNCGDGFGELETLGCDESRAGCLFTSPEDRWSRVCVGCFASMICTAAATISCGCDLTGSGSFSIGFVGKSFDSSAFGCVCFPFVVWLAGRDRPVIDEMDIWRGLVRFLSFGILDFLMDFVVLGNWGISGGKSSSSTPMNRLAIVAVDERFSEIAVARLSDMFVFLLTGRFMLSMGICGGV